MRKDVKDLAVGRWKEILAELGVPASSLTGRHGPCPVCGGTDRFRFDDKEGRGTWFCNQCGAGDGWKLLMLVKEVQFKEAASAVRELLGDVKPVAVQPRPERDVTPRLREIWRQSQRVAIGDPVQTYLARRCGWPTIPKTLRTCMDLEHRDKNGVVTRHPAMLATVTDAHGDPVALHRTYLTHDGRKADVSPSRMALGKLPDGCAVRLDDYTTTIGVAEGIETAISASILFNVPAWACLTANRLAVWTPPEGVTQVIVFGDHDESYVGQSAAYSLAERLERMGVQVQVEIPTARGEDWNDVLVRENSKRGAA